MITLNHMRILDTNGKIYGPADFTDSAEPVAEFVESGELQKKIEALGI